MTKPLLVVEQLVKNFGETAVLTGVDVAVCAGEVLALIGPSGGGKSTLLRCINQLELPTAGQITLSGTPLVRYRGQAAFRQTQKNLQTIRRAVGMVFQQFNLFANMTAERNVVFAQQAALGTPHDEAVERARALLGRVHLDDKLNSFPSQLSGGQQQRVAIARALALSPRLILFDEPTSAIDPEMRSEVLAVIKELADGGMTMIISTHEMHFAEHASDRTLFLCDGKILEQGPSAQVLQEPAEERTRQFLRTLGEG